MTFYHTQEKRERELAEPIFCVKEDAWLGNAFYFWVEESDAVFWGTKIIKKTGVKPTLKEINDYFYEKRIWTHFSGILFQDISENPIHFLVDEFQYKKRIQLALFDKRKINNFAHHFSCEV